MPVSAPRRLQVTAHAKLNLGLWIGARRADSFHDLATVFQSVTLADTLVAERARGFALRIRHEWVAAHGARPAAAPSNVPAGEDNLVLRAARLAAERLGLPGGARFTLVKRIPAEAGLGGGSADAAAALVAMAALHGVRLSRARRIALALELGSDVPFAITGGTAIGRGRGEQLRPVPLARSFRAIVAMPAWSVPTAAAFRRFDRAKYGLTVSGQPLRFTERLGRGPVNPLRASRLGNTFEAILGRRRRDFESLCARMRAAGINEPHLTGSGSGVFGWVPDGASVSKILGRFTGTEPLFVVRSARRGLLLQVQA